MAVTIWAILPFASSIFVFASASSAGMPPAAAIADSGPSMNFAPSSAYSASTEASRTIMNSDFASGTNASMRSRPDNIGATGIGAATATFVSSLPSFASVFSSAFSAVFSSVFVVVSSVFLPVSSSILLQPGVAAVVTRNIIDSGSATVHRLVGSMRRSIQRDGRWR